VEPVPSLGAVQQQAEVDQLVQRIPGDLDRHLADGGGQGRVEVAGRHDRQPPEYPPGGVRQLVVRHPEGARDLQVAGRELIEPVLLVRQPRHQFGRVPAGPADQPVPDDPERQGHALAQLGQPIEGRLLVAGGSRAEDPGQQLGRLRRRQRSEAEPADALQAGQQPFARDQGPAGAVSRQQRAHLLLRPGVVEDDQRLPVPQQRPVDRRALLGVLGDPPVPDAERAQQQPQHVVGGRGPRCHAKQVDEEHPAGEARAQQVRRPDGEGGLAHAARAGDEPDHARAGRALGVDQLAHPDQLRRPAGEVVRQPGQFAQAGRARPVIAQPAVARQLGELPAGVLIQGERVRQSGHGPVLGPLAPSALHVGQGPRADPGRLGQLLQRQPGRAPVTAQRACETQTAHGGKLHRMPPMRWRVRKTPVAHPSAAPPAPRPARRTTTRSPRRTRPAPGRQARPCCRSARRSWCRWSGRR
jgi:hypothetical protein